MSSKFLLSLLTQDQDFQAHEATEAARVAARRGVDVEVVYARNNPLLQAEQLYRAVHATIAARPLAVVVHPVADEGIARVAREAIAAGIGWVQLARDASYIDDLRANAANVPVSVVRTDQQLVGRIQAQQLRERLPSGGSVLYLQGPATTSASEHRRVGLEIGLQGSQISLEVLCGEWTEKSGEEAVRSWLRLSKSENREIQAVCAQNDSMAIGARKAMEARRPEWLRVPFIGCDGLRGGGQRLVNTRELSATVIIESNAGRAIDLLADYYCNNSRSLPRRLVLEPKAYPLVAVPAA
jgi:ABC-type sugar transport system substrate-binding protein